MTLSYCTSTNPSHTIICLHGLGANGADLKPIAEALALPNLRFLFPTAPTRPISINHAYPMPAWYDVKSMNFLSEPYAEETDVDAACALIKNLLAEEKKRHTTLSSENVFLMGFSQGGSIALELGLHASTPFAGIIGLSTLPAKHKNTFHRLSDKSHQTPIFLAHGTEDNIVPFSVGEYIRDRLVQEKYHVEWHQASQPHTIWPEEVVALRQWLLNLMAREK